MEINVDACFKYIQTEANNLGKAKAEVIRLEAKLKATKAAVMADSARSSVSMKEADAYQSLEYEAVVNELSIAVSHETTLSIMVKAAFQKIETARCLEYTKRQELKNLQ